MQYTYLYHIKLGGYEMPTYRLMGEPRVRAFITVTLDQPVGPKIFISAKVAKLKGMLREALLAHEVGHFILGHTGLGEAANERPYQMQADDIACKMTSPRAVAAMLFWVMAQPELTPAAREEIHDRMSEVIKKYDLQMTDVVKGVIE